MSTADTRPASRKLTALNRKLVTLAVVLGILAGGLIAAPAHAAWVLYYNGTLAVNTWKWSGHQTNSGGWAEIQWPFAGQAYLMKSGSGTVYSGYQAVLVTWSSSFTSVACAHVSDGGVAIRCSRQS